jgi:hypothetical protein
MTYKFKIDNDYLSQTEYYSGVSGNKNVYICEFEILCEENGAVWFAVFKKGEKVYITPITQGKCAFPYECLEEACTVYLGCYAELGENKRISTNWIPLKVEDGAYSQGTAPIPPSEDLWETLLSNSVPVIGENGHWYTYDMQEDEYADTGFVARGERGVKGDKGDTGAQGPQGIQGAKGEKGDTGAQGPKGDTGEAGYTPQKGVDYFTQADIAEIMERSLDLLCPKKETTRAVITDAIGHDAIDCTIYGGAGGTGDLVVDGDNDYAQHGGKYRIPIIVHGKNLFDITKNTVGFTGNNNVENTYNADHTVLTIVNKNIYSPSSGFFSLGTFPAGTYYISCVFEDKNNKSELVPLFNNGQNTQLSAPCSVTLSENENNLALYYGFLNAFSPYTLSKVQVEQGTVRTPHAPYFEETVNVYLDSPLSEGESISLSEMNMALPLAENDINTIALSTTVQPSSVKIKYYQDINKVIADLQALILNQ